MDHLSKSQSRNMLSDNKEVSSDFTEKLNRSKKTKIVV